MLAALSEYLGPCASAGARAVNTWPHPPHRSRSQSQQVADSGACPKMRTMRAASSRRCSLPRAQPGHVSPACSVSCPTVTWCPLAYADTGMRPCPRRHAAASSSSPRSLPGSSPCSPPPPPASGSSLVAGTPSFELSACAPPPDDEPPHTSSVFSLLDHSSILRSRAIVVFLSRI